MVNKINLRNPFLFAYVLNSVSVGLTGDIYINENGDREADYQLSDLDPETGIMRPVAMYYGTKRSYEKIQGVEISWPGKRQGPPPDVPYCGFTGNAPHCIVKGKFKFIDCYLLKICLFFRTISCLGINSNRVILIDNYRSDCFVLRLSKTEIRS